MKIYNQEKTQELNIEDLDFKKGYLISDRLLIAHHEAVEARGAVYKDRVEKLPNGSTQTWKELLSPAVEAKEAWDEYEDIQVFVPYTQKELAEREIYALKAKLADTDYRAIKFFEGEMTAEEYAQTKAQRSAWRARINEIEEVLK